MRIVILAAAAATALGLAACSSDNTVRQQALAGCEAQMEQMADQLTAAGVSSEGLCECALEDFDPSASEADIQRDVAAKTQECVMEQMAN